MSISVNPKTEDWVQEKLATGMYQSVDHLLQAALAALDHEEQTLAAIREGHEDYLAGRVVSLDEADEEFFQKYGVRPKA